MIVSQDNVFIKDFLISLFKNLKDMGIEYCVERNYESLPYYIGNDVDIFVRKDHYLKFKDTLLEVAKCEGWILIMDAKGYGGARYYLKRIKSEQLLLIRIDVNFKLHWRGLEFVSEKFILSNRENYNNFYIPGAGVEAAITMLLGLIYNGSVKDAYKERIKEFIKKDPNKFNDVLSNAIGQKWTDRLLEKIASEDWNNIELEASKLRFQVLFRCLCYHPVKLFEDWIKYIISIIQRFFNPTGFFVVLIGPDGSGKSTVSSQLKLKLEKIFPQGKFKIFHWRPNLFPPLNKLLYKQKELEEDYTHPHHAEPYNLVLSLFRFLYYSLDFIIGYWLKIRILKVKSTLVVVERYYYDYLVDMRRYRLKLPKWLIRIVMKVIPKPDLTFCLIGSPEILYNRKQELTVDELTRQMDKIQEILPELPSVYVVDVNKTIEEVIHETIGIILNFMDHR